MLKVTGILLIIFSGLGILGSLAAIGGGAYVASEYSSSTVALAGGGVVIIAGIIMLALSAFQLVMGILGVMTWDKPHKANRCFVMGIISLVLSAISLIFSLMAGNLSGTTLISAPISFVLPVLYTLGAHKLKQGNQM
jgi:hypothetical protein